MRIPILLLGVIMMVPLSAQEGADDLAAVRRTRLTELLPQILKAKNIDCWLTFTREGATDPLLSQLGSNHMVARAALIFAHDRQGNYRRVAIAASYDVTPLESSALYDTVISYKQEGVRPHLQQIMEELDPAVIAVNRSRDVPMADGLTTGMFDYLVEVLPEYSPRFTSSEGLILSLFSRKLPAEIAAVREAAEKTQLILREAFTSKVIKPGRTTENDVANYLRRRAEELGMEESCLSIVAGPMRGHSAPSDRVIRPGDLLRADICFKVRGYSSDIQRTAYVLRKGERKAPDFVLRLWADMKAANLAALAAIKPGVAATEVDQAGRSLLVSRGYEEYPHGAGHSIGMQVHDIGPLPAPDWPERYGSVAFAHLEPGMTMAIEPALYIDEPRLGGYVNFGLEEDILVTEDGYEMLGEPQEELWVIK